MQIKISCSTNILHFISKSFYIVSCMLYFHGIKLTYNRPGQASTGPRAFILDRYTNTHTKLSNPVCGSVVNSARLNHQTTREK
jgi:hypothetical protein